MSVKLKASIRLGDRLLELQPRYFIRASGIVRVDDIKLSFNLEGKLLIIDFKSPYRIVKEFLARPRSILERFKELDQIAREVSRRGLRVEVRVRGVKVYAYP